MSDMRLVRTLMGVALQTDGLHRPFLGPKINQDMILVGNNTEFSIVFQHCPQCLLIVQINLVLFHETNMCTHTLEAS